MAEQPAFIPLENWHDPPRVLARGHLVVKVALDRDGFANCLEKLRAGSDERLRFNVVVDIFHDNERCAAMNGLYVVWLK